MRVNYLLSITLTLLFFGCANIVAPNGGEKDETPPSLLDVKVVNKLKDKDKTSILFTFNEFIEIQKWEDCFYISPPEKIRTQKEINLKNLTLNFSESLNKNTTYHISLDECIKDPWIKNRVEHFNFDQPKEEKIDEGLYCGSEVGTFLPSHSWQLYFQYPKINTSLESYIGRGRNYIKKYLCLNIKHVLKQ
mgnify:CR=1 FL=1